MLGIEWTDEERQVVEEGGRALQIILARRCLQKAEPITTEMADAIFWDKENNKPLPMTREQQAMMIVFGALNSKQLAKKTRKTGS